MRKKSKIPHTKYLNSGIKARTIDKKPIGPCTQLCTIMDGDFWQGNWNSRWKEQPSSHHCQRLKSSHVTQVMLYSSSCAALWDPTIFWVHKFFCGSTDTPGLDFWWRLLRLSKPELAALLVYLNDFTLDLSDPRFICTVCMHRVRWSCEGLTSIPQGIHGIQLKHLLLRLYTTCHYNI